MTNDILKRANEIKDYIAEIRNKIHESPELGMQELHACGHDILKGSNYDFNI